MASFTLKSCLLSTERSKHPAALTKHARIHGRSLVFKTSTTTLHACRHSSRAYGLNIASSYTAATYTFTVPGTSGTTTVLPFVEAYDRGSSVHGQPFTIHMDT